ncbi:MAG: hypothetical protein JXR68_05005 [Bacteroidales bacterium]|nr:hypothetical protein [Bacteroidales bacterium]
MEFYKNLVIVLALIVGFVLLFFGVKDLNIRKKNNGSFFIATLLAVLFFSSCANSQVSNSNIPLFVEQSDRIIKLNKLNTWQQFKALWQQLDNVAPDANVSYSKNTFINDLTYVYSFNSDPVSRDSLTLLFEKQIKELKKTNLLSDDELFALETLVKKRIDFLFLVNFSVFSHFMPPKINLNLEYSLENFELKIDTLVDMFNHSVIDEVELYKAMETITAEVKNILTVSTILSKYQYFIFEGSYADSNSVENNLMYFENHFKILLDSNDASVDYQKKYDDITSNLSRMDSAINGVDEILVDLLFNKNSRFDVFVNTDAYIQFKQFWYNIDTIQKNNYSGSDFNYNKYDHIGNMIAKLDNYILQISETKLFSTVELDLIKQLTLMRLNALQGPNLYTRMYIPVSYFPSTIFEFENKIDNLLLLKSSNDIDESMFQQSLSQLFSVSNNSIILYFINSTALYKIPDDDFQDVDYNLNNYNQIISNHYQNLISSNPDLTDELTIEHNKLISKLLEVTTALPTLNQFIKIMED